MKLPTTIKECKQAQADAMWEARTRLKPLEYTVRTTAKAMNRIYHRRDRTWNALERQIHRIRDKR